MRDAKLKLPITSVNIYIFGQHSAAAVTGHWHYDVSKHLECFQTSVSNILQTGAPPCTTLHQLSYIIL